jgi:hypothetical protein
MFYIFSSFKCPTCNNDDEEFDVLHISNVCIKPLYDGLGKYVMLMMHVRVDDIPSVGHRLDEVHRTKALHVFLDPP